MLKNKHFQKTIQVRFLIIFVMIAMTAVMCQFFLINVEVARAGNTYYVRLDGHDTNCNGTANTAYPGSGTGLNCAWQTINQALIGITSGNGDVINVAAGTYNLTGQISFSKSNFTLQGAGADATILNASGRLGSNIQLLVMSTGTSNVTVSGFTFRGAVSDGVSDRLMHVGVDGAEGIVISNNIFNCNNATENGITVHSTATVTIKNNTFYGCDTAAIEAGGGFAAIVTAYNNIIVDDYSTSGIESTGISASNGSTVTSTFNDIYDVKTGYSNVTAYTGDFVPGVNPYFTNEASGDFSLKTFSRMINAGSADGITADNATELGALSYTGGNGSRTTTINVPLDISSPATAASYAASGDTVSVAASAEPYNNQNATISSANVTFSCAGTAGTCILDGGSSTNNVLTITANGVSVSGFTIRNGGTAGIFKASASPLSLNGEDYSFTSPDPGAPPGALWYVGHQEVTADNTTITSADGLTNFNVALCTVSLGVKITAYHLASIIPSGPGIPANKFATWWNYNIGIPNFDGATITCSFYRTAVFTANGAGSNYSSAFNNGSINNDAGNKTATIVSGFTAAPYLNVNGGVSISNAGTAGSPVTLSNNTITSNGNGIIASGTTVATSNNDSITNNTSSNILATGLTGSGQLTINKTLTVTVTSDLDASGVEGVAISYVDGQSGTGSFASTTNSSGVSSQSLTSLVYAASGASTNYSSYTVTATGASSRTNSSAATIDAANETLALALDYTPPSSTSISINSGDASTDTTAVTLTLAATGATHMMISNSSAFTGAEWETYATSKSWTLDSDMGTKTVYAKFKDTYGNASAAVNDAIIYLLPPPPSRYQPPAAPPAVEPAPSPEPEPAAAKPSAEPAKEDVQPEPAAKETAESPAPESSALQPETSVIPAAPKIVDTAKEQKAQDLLVEIAPAAVEAVKPVLTTFLAYGNQATAEAAPQQRASLLRSFQRAFNDLPVTESHWSDLTRIAQGEVPINRNIPQEAKELSTFVKLEKRLPATKDDWGLLSSLTYGAPLPAKRDLDIERLAIGNFGRAYGYLPVTDENWNVVASLAYGG